MSSNWIPTKARFDFEGCLACRHFNESTVACSAYPNDIPIQIASGEVDHYIERPGQVSGVLFVETTADGSEPDVDRHLGNKHDQQTHAGGRRGKSTSTALSDRTTITDPQLTNEEEAKAYVADWERSIPAHVKAESSLQSIVAFDRPEDASAHITTQYHVGDDELANGVYDRSLKRAVISQYDLDDHEYSGRNFYHEFGHSLEGRIESPAWSRNREWADRLGADEGFAHAFADFMVSKRGGYLDEFRMQYPDTHRLFTEWRFDA